MRDYTVRVTETTVRTYVVSADDESGAVAAAFRFWQFQSAYPEGSVTEHVAVEQVTEVRPCNLRSKET